MYIFEINIFYCVLSNTKDILAPLDKLFGRSLAYDMDR